MHLRGIAAIVTGGASGLGASTAELLAKGGAKVSIFDMNADLGKTTASQIGGNFFQVDVTDEDGVVAGLDGAERTNGIARILVNCAGIAPPERTVNREGRPHSLDSFRRVIEVNLIGTFNVISKFAARLSKAEANGEERGVIVNTASVAAFDGQGGQVAYSASKSGIVGLTLPLARDLAAYGIRVVTIAPGLFLTQMMKSLSPAGPGISFQEHGLPAAYGRSRGIRHAGGQHHSQSDAERRDHPTGWCRTHAAKIGARAKGEEHEPSRYRRRRRNP